MIPNLAIRSCLPELMDDPTCSERLLLRTVGQFASINRLVARYRTILKMWVLDDMMKDPARPYHLVDMGAGGCDIDAWLLHKAHSLGLNLSITACDIDERIINYATQAYGHVNGLNIQRLDLLASRPGQAIDYVFANHFLHHLGDDDIVNLLRFWQPHVRRRLVFSDLERSHGSYAGYALLSLCYPRSFARYDGLVSIRRGFTAPELQKLAEEALPEGAVRIHRLPPGRLALCIEGKRGSLA